MKKKLTSLLKGKKDSIYIKSIENSSSYKDSDGITHTISSFTIELLFEDNYNGIRSGKDKMNDFFPILKDHINIIDKNYIEKNVRYCLFAITNIFPGRGLTTPFISIWKSRLESLYTGREHSRAKSSKVCLPFSLR